MKKIMTIVKKQRKYTSSNLKRRKCTKSLSSFQLKRNIQLNVLKFTCRNLSTRNEEDKDTATSTKRIKIDFFL